VKTVNSYLSKTVNYSLSSTAISDPTERAQKAVELFGARAGVAMANVLDGTKNLDEFIISMDEAAGTVATASDAFDNNLNVQIELAKKMFSGLVQELGEKFMPIVNEILQWVTANIPIIVGYIEDAITFIGSILNPFIDLIKSLINSFSDLNDGTESNFSSIKNIIIEVINAISEFISSFVEFLKSLWDLLGEDLIEGTRLIWNNIMEIIKGVLEILEGIFKVFTSLLKGDWQGLWEGIKTILSGALNTVVNLIGMSINTITTIWKTGWNLVKSIFISIWDGIYKFISDIVENIKNTVLGVVNSVTNAINKIKEWNFLKPKTHTLTTVNETISSNIPKYDVGTPFVPTDQLAFIHKGEVIIPSQLNPFNNKDLFNKSEIKIDSLLTVNGDVNKETMPELNKLMDKTISKLVDTLNLRGYNRPIKGLTI